jgi:diacylglycerol kinase (ATP)
MNVRQTKVVCIINPTAGTRRDVRRVVEQVLQTSGVDFVFCETQTAGHAFLLAQEAVASEAGCVIGIGGDGTLNEVARALVDTGVPLGIIPVGSGNAFARALHISTSPRKACVQLLGADVKRLDVGTVEDEVFLSTAGVGLDAEVAWKYGARKGKRRGLIPYMKLTLGAIRQYEPKPLRLILDDDFELTCCPSILVVANTAQYGNGVIIAPGANAEDGLLDVRVIEPKSTFSMAIHGWRLFSGSIDQMPGVKRFQAQKVRVEREMSGYYQFDGEALDGAAELTFSVKKRALSVLVPKGQ